MAGLLSLPSHIGLGSILGGAAGTYGAWEDNPLKGALLGALAGGVLGGLRGGLINKTLTNKLNPSELDTALLMGSRESPLSLLYKSKLNSIPVKDWTKDTIYQKYMVDRFLSQYADEAIVKHLKDATFKEILLGKMLPSIAALLSPVALAGGYHAGTEFNKFSHDTAYELGRKVASLFLMK